MLAVLGMALGIGLLIFLLLRHAALAFAIALAPLPAALFLWSGHGTPLPVFGFGMAAAVLAAADAVPARITGTAADWTPMLLAACGGTLLMLLQSWPLGMAFAIAGLCAWGGAAALRWAAFDEDVIARINRLGERCAILLEGWGALAEIRWGLALTGAGLVLVAVAVFRQPLGLTLNMTTGQASGLAILLLTLLGTTRDWRAALAAFLAGMLMLLFAPGLPQFGFLVLPLGLRTGVPGNDAQSRRRALEQAGGLALAGIAGLTALSWAAWAALLAGLVFFPAVTAVLHGMFTPRRSVEHLYRN